MKPWTSYLEIDGPALVYGLLSLRLTRKRLRLRQIGDRVKPIASPRFRAWLEENGGGEAETDWHLPLDARVRLTRNLRKFVSDIRGDDSAKRLGEALLAALSGFPPGEHYGRPLAPDLERFVANVLKAVKRGDGYDNIPWLKAEQPQNGVTRRPYTGMNRMMLQFEGHESPFWYTLKQVRDLGGRVRRGQRFTPVFYVRRRGPWRDDGPKPGDELDDKTFGDAYLDHMERKWDAGPITHWYEHQLYNWSQTEGIKEPERGDVGGAHLDDEVEELEALIDAYFSREGAPQRVEKGSFAFYQHGPRTDRVVVPPISQFRTRVGYYQVLLHEMVHSTGHPARLNRTGLAGRAVDGRAKYSHEELVAEIGAAWLLADAGLDPKADPSLDPVEYCRGWLTYLKNDGFALVSAAGHANRACAFIRGEGPKPPSARDRALAWLVKNVAQVDNIESAASSKGASKVAVTLSGRKTPLFVKTYLCKGSNADGYTFTLSAADVKAWHGSRGERTRAALHGLLLVPLSPEGGFEPTDAPAVLLRLQRLFDAGLNFNYFKGLGGQNASLGLKLFRRSGRQSWHLANSRAGVNLRLRPSELLESDQVGT